jgi:non-specific serine/threonine protein kinase
LAIELAAASVRLLTPREMVRRLEAGLHALPVAQRDAPRRHESVIRAIDWSYGLLSAPEQDLFRRLSIFSGGCSLDAAEQVAAAHVDFLARLDGVASQSLVRVDTDDGDVRLSMLQTVAEFGRQRLSEAGDAQKVQHALATYFLTLAERERRAISSADQTWALRRLEREHGNLRAALEHLMTEGSADEACRMAAALAPFWRDHGHLDEGRRWLDEALRRADDADQDIRMGVVLGAALIAYEDDRVDDAGAMANTALAYYVATGDACRVIEAREVLAAIDRFHGEHLQSITQYDEALDLARGLEDRWLVAHLLERRGIAAWAAGDYAAAESSLSAALTRFRELGDEQGEAFALWQLGSVDAVAGRIQLGLRRMEQAVPVLRRGRHRRQLARALWNIGVASVRIGHPDRAEEALVEATRMFRDVKFGRHMAAMLLAYAELAAFRGNHAHAARLLGATSAEWDRWHWTPSAPIVEVWEECAARVRANLGPDGFTAASSDGRALSLEEAMEDAVRSGPSVPTGLSAREIDVLELVADGLSNAEVADRLYVSVRTVHAHLRSAYTKLGVGSRTAAVRRASELGVVSSAAAR